MRSRALILYDGQCRLCQQSVRLLARLDWLGVMTLGNARDPQTWPARHPRLDQARLLEQMHLLAPNGRLFRGFAAFRWIAWRLPLLWPLAPLLYLPGVPEVGQRMYLWVARNRFRLVPCHGGICTLTASDQRARLTAADNPQPLIAATKKGDGACLGDSCSN